MSVVYKIASGSYIPSAFPCSKTTLKPNIKCPQPGIDAEFLGRAMEMADISYELVSFKESRSHWGTIRNGSWNGLLGMVYNGTIDTINIRFVQIPIRNKDFEFSYPISQEEAVFVVRQESRSFFLSSSTVFQVFRSDLWASVIGCLLVALISMQLAGNIVSKRWPSSNWLTWNSLRMFLHQGAGSITDHQCSGANLLIVWLGLISTFAFNLYQGCLSTRFLHPPTVPPFKNIRQVASVLKSGEMRMIINDWGFWYVDEMQTSQYYMYKLLREALKHNPPVLEPNMTKALEMVESGEYIWPLGSLTAHWVTRHRCSLTVVSSEDQPRKWHSFIFNRNSSLVWKLNKVMIGLQSTNVAIRNKYEDQERKFRCFQPALEQSDKWQPLTVFSMAGVIVLLMFGCALAALALYAEIIKHTAAEGQVLTNLRKITVQRVQEVMSMRRYSHIPHARRASMMPPL